MSWCLLAVALAAQLKIQDPPVAVEPDLRAALEARVHALHEAADTRWFRLDFDDRWCRNRKTVATLDGRAHAGDIVARDTSYVVLPVAGLAPAVVTGLRLSCSNPPGAVQPFLITDLRVFATPSRVEPIQAARVRIVLPGAGRQLRLAEVRLRGARLDRSRATADQSSIGVVDGAMAYWFLPPGPRELTSKNIAARALDGLVDAPESRTIAVTATQDNPWWEVSLGGDIELDGVEVFGDPSDLASLDGFVVVCFTAGGVECWRSASAPAPRAGVATEVGPRCTQPLRVVAHSASSFGSNQELARALAPDPNRSFGFGPGGASGSTAVLAVPELPWPASTLRVEMHQEAGQGRVLGAFGVEVTTATGILPPVPYLADELLRVDRPWTSPETNWVRDFMQATTTPTGAWSLSDGLLVERAYGLLDPADLDTPDLIRTLHAHQVIGLTGLERVTLAALLERVRR